MEKIYKIALVVLCIVVVPIIASAATLTFSPSVGEHTIGSTFQVVVSVSTPDQAMNAASGVVSFPPDKLEVISLQKSGSIFSLWAQEPTFSNTAGTVNFEGIVLNPGYTGTAGTIVTINFRAKAAGIAPLKILSGSVLANDGTGTNILSDPGTAQFNLAYAPEPVQTSTTPAIVADTPSAPTITSSTHPDSSKWYAKKNARFSWHVGSDITAVRLSVGSNPRAIPSILYAPPVNEKEIKDMADGVWYFNVQLRNANGWGDVSHFRFQIDTESPRPLKIRFIDSSVTKNSTPTVTFDTTDALSGIEYYKVKVGDGDFFSLSSDIVKSNPYTIAPQNIGSHNILVQAFDKAGNYSVDSTSFTIDSLQAPTIVDYSDNIQSGDPLIVHGSTYPNSKITMSLQGENEDPHTATVYSDAKGKFTFVSDQRLGDGIYKLWAEVEDARGAKSTPSEKLTINVAKPALVRAGAWAISAISILIPLAALAFLLIIIIWYGWHKLRMMRKHIRREVHEAESALHKAFDLMKESIHEQVKMLEKTGNERQLTHEEERIIAQLKRNLSDAEKYIKKEIDDIGNEVK